MTRLRITEIFYSLQGESNTVGLPTVFVRLTGCPLRCGYCDTTYAFKGGEWMSLAQILASIIEYTPRYVTVTGGEPMAQKACAKLLTALCDAGYQVSLETSGAVDLSVVDPRVVKVMDLKTPGSGEMEKNLYNNVDTLAATDQVKFVICDEADYLWSRQQVEALGLDGRCEVLFSPALGQQDATELAEWIIRDRLQVRFQIQLHKYLWGDVAGK
ncbi:7-carboxy-7-deazaguanine synthase QueE [Solemya velesiana gill symbiont]|uniref:7-carboxy-7-deazaguanine synthase n=1 Tax=Solemya velesiana gill symbiont TaxID=1918948 RepID=A0A1T2KTP4_9GAMM|nr:7-carboxy-7-deazaguanine synthase QueE [Solemya velesiana gill symbiont]OOZ36110.1 7-carboxy-7-deazaguanine synthase QueE [Solemya velesiana gill symbiont]